MTTAAWFHCFAGIAGDMALGSLIDAGADVDEVRTILRSLDVPDWTLEVQEVERKGLRAKHVEVRSDERDVVRTFATIKLLLEQAALPVRVRDRSLSVFTALAEAEGRVHGQSPEQVHFHEVGGVDAIVDIVGTCAALEVLGIEQVYASAIANGSGTIRTAHGVIPNPAPAVVSLLREAPVYGVDENLELTTPTGAAILSALASGFGAMPSFGEIRADGFGAGTRDLRNLPNCTQVIVGTLAAEVSDSDERLVVLEANLDDVTGEVLAHSVASLMKGGALDAWLTPIVMKKGRPAHTVSVLARPVDAFALSELMVRETGTFGVRAYEVSRRALPRRVDTVDIDGDPVSVKVGSHRVKAEFDEAALVAERLNVSVRDVARRAEESWYRDDDQ